jgi:eukaryotic-like serine/threonine-protein kinase
MSLDEAVAVIVPVCMDLHERHARGERLYVHPSAIAPGADGLARLDPRLAIVPTQTFDKHCLAPELQRGLEPGDACSSVFSIGAMLYEMVTGLHVGSAMKRPREIEPSLPESLEVLIGKSIIGDRTHRPADLGALASALYHVAPRKSIHPPDVSEARLDASAQLDVDVRFSMLPPSVAPVAQAAHAPASNRDASHVSRLNGQAHGGDPYGAPVIDRNRGPASRKSADDPTAKLGALKARLESDPRPRYVVNKDKMDHGPFSAVELLQQIASHAFVGDDGLRDEISGQHMPISEWEEFSPFATQAGLLREKRAEEKAVVRAADADKKRGLAKSILAVSLVVALAGAGAVWFLTRRGTRNEDVVVSNDRGGAVVVNGDIKGKKRPGAGGPGHAGGGGGFSSGQSYEAVLNSNNESVTMGESQGQPDLTNAQLAGPLRHASFVTGCGAPDDMKVQVRVAVRMGVPIGVTVSTTPSSAGVASCIDRAVRGLRWQANPKTDFVTTNY